MSYYMANFICLAFADQLFEFPTLSWNLGEKVSSIELGTSKISTDEIKKLEDAVNCEIRKAVPVITKEYEASDPELMKVRFMK